MRPSSTLRILLGLLVGTALASIGLYLGSAGADAVPDDPGVTRTAPQSVVYLSPGETVLGPNLLIPTSMSLGGTELALQYDIVPVAPPVYGVEIDLDTIPSFWRPTEGAALAAPETWTLTTVSGDTIKGTTANSRSRAARFQVPEGFTLDQVDEIWIDTWRMRIPVGFDIEIARDQSNPILLDVESAVALRNVLDQATNTIVQLDIESPLDAFSRRGSGFVGLEDLPQVYGVGPDWTAVGPLLDSSNTGGDGLQLTYEGDRLGDLIALEVVTTDWVVFSRPVVVDLEFVREETS